jgi:hypothetical protein
MVEAGWMAEGLTAVGIALLNSGIQGLLAPDPSVEEEQKEGYLYTGSEGIVIEGDPVPLLYGELRVPGQPISMALNSVSETRHVVEKYRIEDDIFTSNTGDSYSTMGLEEYDTSQNLHNNFNSDIRLKENIKPLGKINGVNIYSWDWNEKGRELGGGQPTVGVIAQEVVKTRPDAVRLEKGYYVVDYNKVLGKNMGGIHNEFYRSG